MFPPLTGTPFLPSTLNPNEPALLLPAPHSDIILTPPRLTDIPSLVRILNDPLVYPWVGTPYPHTDEHARAFVERERAKCERALDFVEKDGTRVYAGCPVRSIRLLKRSEDGSVVGEVFIGDIGIFRWHPSEILDATEKTRLMKEN